MAAPEWPAPPTRPPPVGPASHKADKQSLPELGKELIDLTVTYAKQETIDPLRSLGRRVGLGVLGSAVASVGLIFLLVGVLRLVQVEVGSHLHHFQRGAFSWVPYLAAVLVAGAVAAFAVKQMGGDRGGR